MVKDAFTFGEEDKTALGVLGKLTDIIYAPINAAISFVRTLFGWQSPTDEPFKLQDFIADMFNSVLGWFVEKLTFAEEKVEAGVDFISSMVKDAWQSVKDWFFSALQGIADSLPSIEDIRNEVISILPAWMVPDAYKSDSQKAEALMGEIDNLQKAIEADTFRSVGFSAEDEKAELAAALQQLNELQQKMAQSPAAMVDNSTTVNNFNQNDNSSSSVAMSGVPGTSADPLPQ